MGAVLLPDLPMTITGVSAVLTSVAGLVLQQRRRARLEHESQIVDLRNRLCEQYAQHEHLRSGYVLARREAIRLTTAHPRAVSAGWSTSPPVLPVDGDAQEMEGPLVIVDLDPTVDARAAAREQAARAVQVLGAADEVEVALRAAWELPTRPGPTTGAMSTTMSAATVTAALAVAPARRGSRWRLVTAYARVMARQVVDDITGVWR